MDNQTEALRLADELAAEHEHNGWGEPDYLSRSAAELRRLHAENERLRAALHGLLDAPEPDYIPTRKWDEARAALKEPQ